MTAYFMKLAYECNQENLFNVHKSDLKPIWERLSREVSEAYPKRPITPGECQAKFEVERQRFIQFVSLTKSGINLDKKGIVQVPPKKWERFLSRHPEGIWLKTQPLGNVLIYQHVFFRETGLGKHIREAGDISDGPTVFEIDSSDEERPRRPHRRTKKRKMDDYDDDDQQNETRIPRQSVAYQSR
ncbi:hypothetical protein M426DRAFT_324912 [Hypoxylon sp. CI-4A]|nr:hypothetical protein M426DRAFT_324912 [Hypoxylon sp. CI-4A]